MTWVDTCTRGTWPTHAFGTANASVLDELADDKSWDLLHRGLVEAFGLVHPWATVMVACLNPQAGPTGKADRLANRDA